MIKKSTVIIMRGIPGSGKSTYVHNRITAENNSSLHAVVCSADDWFIKDGIYTFDSKQLSKAHEACFLKFEHRLRVLSHTLSLNLIIVDNTNIRAWEFAGYVQLARAYGYDVEIVRLHVDPEVAAKRNVHGVPERNIIRMAQSMEKCPLALGIETVIEAQITPK